MIRLWPRRRYAEPGTGRDETGRVYDFDTVRPEGHRRWADVLPAADALTEPAHLLPTVGPGYGSWLWLPARAGSDRCG